MPKVIPTNYQKQRLLSLLEKGSVLSVKSIEYKKPGNWLYAIITFGYEDSKTVHVERRYWRDHKVSTGEALKNPYWKLVE
jgi:hypothetical protein